MHALELQAVGDLHVVERPAPLPSPGHVVLRVLACALCRTDAKMWRRGPTTEELAGAWDALDRYDAAKVTTTRQGAICNIVGTGSDSLKTINCSTPAFLIAAACGLTMAKKGARLVTGVSGASDILDVLGIDLNAPLSQAEACLDRHGLCYLPGEAFLKSGWARLIRVMSFTSAFNIIGPLTFPCRQTNRIVIGACAPSICDQLIDILREIGVTAAVASYGMADGIDPTQGMAEFSPCGPTRVTLLRNGAVTVQDVTPEDFGTRRVAFETVASRKTAAANARRILEVLEGDGDSPEADFFCMNAAAALHIADVAPSYSEGFTKAKAALAAGKAREKLEQLRELRG